LLTLLPTQRTHSVTEFIVLVCLMKYRTKHTAAVFTVATYLSKKVAEKEGTESVYIGCSAKCVPNRRM